MKIAIFKDLHHYILEDIGDKNVSVASDDILNVKMEDRGFMKTDPWMNRYCIFENNGLSYSDFVILLCNL